MPFKIGPIEIVLILVIVFIIFGAGRLPQLFDLIGRGVRSITGSKKKDEGEEIKTKKAKKGSAKS